MAIVVSAMLTRRGGKTPAGACTFNDKRPTDDACNKETSLLSPSSNSPNEVPDIAFVRMNI